MRLRAYQRHRPDGRPRPLAAAAAILMVASLASAGLRRRGDRAGANGAEMGSTLKRAAIALSLQLLARRVTQPRRTPDA